VISRRLLFAARSIVYIPRSVKLQSVALRVGYLGVLAIAAVCLAWGCGMPKAGMARGQELFENCQPCHGPHGAGDLALRTPAIAGLPAWYLTAELAKFRGNIRGAHPDDSEGHRMRPMARALYHPNDIESVAEYVSKLPHVPAQPMLTGDAAAGQKQYMAICIACHGPDGKGNQAMNAPPLVGQHDWYLLAQLKKFKTGMRGAHPEDVSGSQMRAMSSTLTDTTAMHDVVAYIKTLPQ
jgi:cytochrome c553